jgi:hypothetical protein
VHGLGAPDETRAFGKLIEALREAEETSRLLGAIRRQGQWLLIGKQLGDMRELVGRLSTARFLQ